MLTQKGVLSKVRLSHRNRKKANKKAREICISLANTYQIRVCKKVKMEDKINELLGNTYQTNSLDKVADTQSKVKKKFVETLKNIGVIASIISGIVYLALICLVVYGVYIQGNDKQTMWTMLAINTAFGLIFTFLLRYQGEIWGKDEHKELMQQYYTQKSKSHKLHSMRWFWVTSTIKTLIFKGGFIAVSSWGIMELAFQGSREYVYLALAIVNAVLFVAFGLIALYGAYQFVQTVFVSFVRQELDNIEKEQVIHKEPDIVHIHHKPYGYDSVDSYLRQDKEQE